MKAHELLADRNKWTQGARARNAAGEQVPVSDDSAATFCGDGAIMKCYLGTPEYYEARDRADRMADRLFGRIMPNVNDRLGYDAVMKVLREADV